jgi:hypothetical protein
MLECVATWQVRESMTIAEHGLDAKASFSAAAK